jgi:hypothetical protein
MWVTNQSNQAYLMSYLNMSRNKAASLSTSTANLSADVPPLSKSGDLRPDVWRFDVFIAIGERDRRSGFRFFLLFLQVGSCLRTRLLADFCCACK